LLEKVGVLVAELHAGLNHLAETRTHHADGLLAEATHYCHDVLPQLVGLRKVVDALETLCPDESWPVPTYEEMLFIK